MSKYVEFKLDKTRNVKLGMKALIKIEKKIGTFSKLDFDNIKFEEVLFILCAGLQHEDPDINVEKLADLIDEYSDITTALNVMGEAMESAFGNSKNAQAAKNPKK